MKSLMFAVVGFVCWCGVSDVTVLAKDEPSAVALEMASYTDELAAHPQPGDLSFDELAERELVRLLTSRQYADDVPASLSKEKIADLVAGGAGTDGTRMGIFLQQMLAYNYHGQALACAIDCELHRRGLVNGHATQQRAVAAPPTPSH